MRALQYLAVFFIFASSSALGSLETKLYTAPLRLPTSALHTYTGYNSENHFGTTLQGQWAIDSKLSLQAAYTQAHNPEINSPFSLSETYHAGQVIGSYGAGDLGLQLGSHYSIMSTTETYGFGGHLGLLYTWRPLGSYDLEDLEQQPDLWLQLIYDISTFKSPTSPVQRESAHTMHFLFEVNKTINADHIIAAKTHLFHYQNEFGFFQNAIQSQINTLLDFKSITAIGLPRTIYEIYYSTKISKLDLFIPQYFLRQARNPLRYWVHTFSFAWEHQFLSSFAFKPSYEMSLQNGRNISGFTLSLHYTP